MVLTEKERKELDELKSCYNKKIEKIEKEHKEEMEKMETIIKQKINELARSKKKLDHQNDKDAKLAMFSLTDEMGNCRIGSEFNANQKKLQDEITKKMRELNELENTFRVLRHNVSNALNEEKHVRGMTALVFEITRQWDFVKAEIDTMLIVISGILPSTPVLEMMKMSLEDVAKRKEEMNNSVDFLKRQNNLTEFSNDKNIMKILEEVGKPFELKDLWTDVNNNRIGNCKILGNQKENVENWMKKLKGVKFMPRSTVHSFLEGNTFKSIAN